jgi:glycosyltransferase involved in cell wall biosynthesis
MNTSPQALKRALFVTATETPYGAEQSLRTLLEAAPLGWSCSLLASSQKVADLCGPFTEETQLIAAHPGKLRTLVAFGRQMVKLRRDYDVIVLFSLKLLPLTLTAKPRGQAARMVADIHDAPVGMDLRLSRFFLRFADGIVAISRFVVQHLGIRGAVIVPRPIADDANSTSLISKESPEKVALGIIGRLDPEKRIEVAIDAMQLLPPHYVLRIYGDPCVYAGEEYVQVLKSRAAHSALIDFCGYASADQIYDEVDGVIVCNEREPSGRTVGEAMLRSKVVFAPDSGGAMEYFDDSVTGFRYRARDSESLASVIDGAFQPSRDLTRLRGLAREKIIEERSPRVVAEEYFGFLDRVAEGSGES